jgi:hypothetical protein
MTDKNFGSVAARSDRTPSHGKRFSVKRHALTFVFVAHVPQSCLHGIDAWLQTAPVGDLDIEAGASIDLKDQRPFVFVEDDVNALVAEAGEFMSA